MLKKFMNCSIKRYESSLEGVLSNENDVNIKFHFKILLDVQNVNHEIQQIT